MKKSIFGLAVVGVVLLGACANTDVQNKPPQACRADGAASLVGKRDWNDEQIKQATGASMVRRALPNQPLTADYRADRVTVLIDVTRKQIIRATCG